jgi:hypothetical protein
MNRTLDGAAITIAQTTVALSLSYPDGSQVVLTMPKPSGIESHSSDHVEALVRRMAGRLLTVASEDLKTTA